MVQIVDLIIEGEVNPVKLIYIVQADGSILYKCELDGIALSTFSFRNKYEGKTADEALQSIAKEIIRAKAEFLEI